MTTRPNRSACGLHPRHPSAMVWVQLARVADEHSQRRSHDVTLLTLRGSCLPMTHCRRDACRHRPSPRDWGVGFRALARGRPRADPRHSLRARPARRPVTDRSRGDHESHDVIQHSVRHRAARPATEGTRERLVVPARRATSSPSSRSRSSYTSRTSDAHCTRPARSACRDTTATRGSAHSRGSSSSSWSAHVICRVRTR
jgi:hypothetical protein